MNLLVSRLKNRYDFYINFLWSLYMNYIYYVKSHHSRISSSNLLNYWFTYCKQLMSSILDMLWIIMGYAMDNEYV